MAAGHFLFSELALMKLSIAKDDGQRVQVAVTGPMTQQDGGAFGEPLAELLGPRAYARQVRLDLRETSHVDSSGVGWLLTCHKRMRQAGGKLTLHAPHPIVANVLRVLKLEKVFEIEEGGGGDNA
jgi:anti-anti-sigma factor